MNTLLLGIELFGLIVLVILVAVFWTYSDLRRQKDKTVPPEAAAKPDNQAEPIKPKT